MEPNEIKKNNAKKMKKYERNTVLVSKETKTALKKLCEQANRKKLGRKIKEFEIINKSILLLSSEHIEELKKDSLSYKDRIELQYQNYVEANGQITREKFNEMLHNAFEKCNILEPKNASK